MPFYINKSDNADDFKISLYLLATTHVMSVTFTIIINNQIYIYILIFVWLLFGHMKWNNFGSIYTYE